MTRRWNALLTVMLVLTAAACKPKAGASCKIETKEVCIDEKKALACHDGKWEEMTCKGESGCTKSGGENTCDQTVADDKDVCNLADDYVCTPDKKSMLQCVKNRWTQVQSCLGDRACVMEKRKVTCDNSIAILGDGCREEEDYACTPDKKSALACHGGKFLQASLCRGPKGCRVTGAKESGFKVECDDTVANPGDPCEKETHFSCTPDERTMLRCHAKKFDVEERCLPKTKCSIRDGVVGCW